MRKVRKRILLITPENQEIHRFRKRQFNNFIQLTMPYLAGFIDETRYQITLVDEYNQKIPFDSTFDLVAVTVNTPNATHCYRIAERFRRQGAKVVLGGPHVTLLPDEAGVHGDHLMIGEGEETWPRFLDDFYQDRAGKVYTSLQPPDLSGLPIPRRDLVRRRYLTRGAVFSTRGCPYQCSYCNLKQIYHEPFRTRPVAEVIQDVQSIKGRYFVFWDDNFFGDPAYAKSLMTELKTLKRRWAAQVTLDRCRDEELVKLAKQSGCTYLFIGLESFSRESLESVNKGLNRVEEYKTIISMLHRNGICIQAGIIFGFDTDTKEVFQQTLAACNKMGIDGVTVSVLTPLPGTPVFEQMKASGRLLTEDWCSFNGKTAVAFRPLNMSAEELYAGYLWFRERFYSLRSIVKRLAVSRTNLLHNLVVNIGYRLSLPRRKKRDGLKSVDSV